LNGKQRRLSLKKVGFYVFLFKISIHIIQTTKNQKEISYLGIVDADPRDYVTKYGPSLKRSTELPSFVNELERIPQEADHSNQLIGDIESLKFLDPDTLGLK